MGPTAAMVAGLRSPQAFFILFKSRFSGKQIMSQSRTSVKLRSENPLKKAIAL